MIPAILHFVVPATPSAMQAEAIALARSLHPHWDIRIWHDTDSVAGGRLGDYSARCGSGAQRADLIRLEAVASMGGVYLDSDIYLRRPLNFLLRLDNFVLSSEDGDRATNAFFGAPPQHSATCALIQHLLENEPNWQLPPNETTGPELFSSILHYRSDVTVLPRESFYPYNWNETRPQHFPPAMCGVHEWSRSWHTSDAKQGGGPKNARRARDVLKESARPLQSIARRLVAASLPLELRELPHQQARPSYSVGGDVVTVTKNGIKMALPGADLSLTPSLVLSGEFERNDEQFVLSVVRGGDWIIDVGANVGLYTLLAASRCGPFGRVFALEPNGETAAYLQRSVLMNWFQDRVRLLPLAASNETGDRTLEGTSSRLGDFRLKGANSAEGAASLTYAIAGETIEKLVRVARLDDLFPDDIPIRLLKIDAEGHDAQVLEGATRLIESRSIQYVMIEVSRDSTRAGIGALIAALRSLVDAGYRPSLSRADGTLQGIDDFERHIPAIGHVDMIFTADWHGELLKPSARLNRD